MRTPADVLFIHSVNIVADKRFPNPVPERECTEPGKADLHIGSDPAADGDNVTSLYVQVIQGQQHMLVRFGINIAMMMLGQNDG